ncbi:hypothetical protein PG993_002505 [Apiospora rasikravindrae]|uniref:DUF7908 domain-containing protein n=1 Tax=Apiospora rasikravindrae TaxID=990691 RepID=A0ABR1TWT9_9PEZI
MRKRLSMYWFLAASKFSPARCEKRSLEAGFAHYQASLGAESICYTYITTIVVTIATDLSDTQGQAATQPQSPSSPYLSDCLLRPTQTQIPTQTRGQVGPGYSSVGGSGSQRSEISDSRDRSTMAASKTTPVASIGVTSDTLPSELQISSTTSFNLPLDTGHGGGGSMSTFGFGISQDTANTPSDSSLNPDPAATEAASAGASSTTSVRTSEISSGDSTSIGEESTIVQKPSTPRTSERPGDVGSGTLKTRSGTTEPTIPYSSIPKSPSVVIPPSAKSTSKEGPATKSVGTLSPASTTIPQSDATSRGPTDPVPTSDTATEEMPSQPVSLTTQTLSSPVASIIILSIEATATPGPAIQTTTRMRPRIDLRKRDLADGFVGNRTDPNPDSCSDAVRFRQSDGRLQRRGRDISVDPGVDYINLVNYAGGSITTTFSVANDTLQWTNDAFYDGRATFCQVGDDGPVYAVLTSAGGPEGCSPVALVIYRGTQSPSTGYSHS